MDWTSESEAPEPSVSPAPEPILAISHRGRVSLNLFAALLLIVVIGGFGFTLGHFVFRSSTTQVRSAAAPATNPFTTFPNFGNFTSPSATTPSSGSNTASNTAAAKIATKVDPAIVDIDTSLSYQGSQAAGTGIVLSSNGYVLTNNHVIDGATSITARDVGNGKTYTATVVGYDITKDLAVLKLQSASGLATVTLGDSSKLTKGESVVGIGNAGGTGGTPSYASGTVQALKQSLSAGDEESPTGVEQLSGMIESSTNIQPGDSGGPLVNKKGAVVGIDTAASTTGGGYGFQNFTQSGTQAYSIPINTAITVAKSIEKGNGSSTIHIGDTAFLGVEIQSGTSASSGSSSSVSGAVVEATIPGTPAASSALVAGDVITALNGTTITSSTALQTALQPLHPGETVQITYVDQNGVQGTTSIQLASGPSQ
jgi:S1-C subfamily serine protease